MEIILNSIYLITIITMTVAICAVSVAMILEVIGVMQHKVPFIPASQAVVSAVVALAPKNSGVFYDLGSGEGQVVVAVAEAYPDMRAVGIERSPLPTLVTKLTRGRRPKNANFLFKDFNNHSFNDASFVYAYLLTKVTHDLEPKFERELAPGTRLVCCDFPLKIRQPSEKRVVGRGLGQHTLYVYDF